MKKNIWIILDGKKGHEKQIEDLVYCLGKKIDINIYKVESSGFLKVCSDFLYHLSDKCSDLPKPDFIIACGHRTHLEALQKRSRYGGKIIILMKPTLPLFLFDLSIIPAHDKILWSKNTLVVNGSINKLYNKNIHKKNMALILIGGPSKNYYWDNNQIINNIENIVKTHLYLNFTVVTSRRTPQILINNLEKKSINIRLINDENAPANWLEKNIDYYEHSWVTQDSISMLFELLAAGSRVNCIGLKNRNSKFKKLFNELYEMKKINFSNKDENILEPMNLKVSTASQCADYIIKKFNINYDK